MWQNAHDAYLESRILSAGPVELIRLLYQAAIGSVREARRQLAAGEIAERSRAINKACAIVLELSSSLDYARGGEVSVQLGRLYEYITRRLIESNLEQADAPLVEVLGLLTTLLEGWGAVQAETAPPEPAAAPGPWAQPPAAEAQSARLSQGWSF